MEDTRVLGVTFQEASVEFQYVELREQNENAGVLRTLVVVRDFAERDFDNLSDMCQEIIDNALQDIRLNPIEDE